MTLVFRDSQVLVISPGSQTTLAQNGLGEILQPAAVEVPTVVYRQGKLFCSKGEEENMVRPIVKGAIADEAAFHYFLKIVYRALAPKDSPPPALLLVSSLAWNRRQIDRLVRYLFEEVKVPALSLCLQGLATAFAYAVGNCMIIDVGFEKTEITALSDFEPEVYASRIVPVGGATVNKTLSEALPDLSPSQIEDLKWSPICEVLTQEGHNKWLRQQNEIEGVGDVEEDGVVDIAAIVSSGRTREILEERERKKLQNSDEPASNKDLASNTFTDRDGVEHTVGRERFMGCEVLLDELVDAVGETMMRINPHSLQHIMDNVIVVGRGSRVHGFKTELLTRIGDRYVVSIPPTIEGIVRNDSIMLNGQSSRSTPDEPEAPTQAPTSISTVKMADHFPDWRAQKWDNISFLGAEIAAKQTFTAGIEGVFISRQDYNEVGPTAIWNVY